MNEQQKEFLNQINREIERLLKSIFEKKTELKNNIDSNSHNIITFGLAKYGEQITVYTAQLEILKTQREIFMSIFELDM